jgi:hypothetical protein
MADYHTPTVIEPMIPVSAVLPVEGMFLAHVLDAEIDSSAVYYFSEQGANDLVFFDPEELREALDAADHSSSRLVTRLLEDHADALRGDDDIEFDLAGDLLPQVLQDIVRRTPDLDAIYVTMAFTCTKMRPDGFGGLAMLITNETIRSESTNALFERFYEEAIAKGEISSGNA